MLTKPRLGPTIIVPTLLMGLAGYLVSFAFPAKYISLSLVLVEAQRVPPSIVQPVVSEDLTERVATLQQQVVAQSRLQPVVERLYPGKTPEEYGAIIDDIRQSMQVEPVMTALSALGAGEPLKPGESPVPGFYVKYMASNPREAQQICNELTTLFIDQNLRSIQEAATGTSEVLNRGTETARQNLGELARKLENLKQRSEAKSDGADVETQRRILNTEYEVAQHNYESLLAKKAAADLTVMMNNMAEGERMVTLNPANLPDAPEFPNRVLFAGFGLSAGLALGVGLALWTKRRSKLVKTEAGPVNLT